MDDRERWYDSPPPVPHSVRTWTFGAIVAAIVAAALYFGLVKGNAQPTVGGPFGTNVVVGTSSVQIIGTNPSRRAITICNGAAATNNIAIAPAPLTPVSGGATGVGIQIAAATNSVPNCYTSPFLTNSGTSGGVTAAWNAIASAATTNVLVLEW